LPGDALDHLDRPLDMRPLLLLRHIVVVDPAPTVAGHLVSGLHHSPSHFGIALERHPDRVDREREAPLGEQAQDPPEAGASTVFVDRFDVEVAGARPRQVARNFVQIDLGGGVAVQHGGLTAFLVIEDEAQRQTGPVRPAGRRRIAPVADHIARIGLGHLGSLPIEPTSAGCRRISKPELSVHD
jgi:hypothetical protein